jgi:hypothetical protein
MLPPTITQVSIPSPKCFLVYSFDLPPRNDHHRKPKSEYHVDTARLPTENSKKTVIYSTEYTNAKEPR